MAGGTWTTQNKVRPGVYIRFQSAPDANLSIGNRGVAAICEPLSWGPIGQVMTVNAGADTTPFTGYAPTEEGSRFLAEIFKGTNRTAAPSQVLLYRPAANGSAAATATAGALTITAKYQGIRGNDISVIIAEDPDNEGNFTVTTVVDGLAVDRQAARIATDLKPNNWVGFTGDGALTATTGAALEGGSNGTVQAAAYSAFLTAIEPYKFDVLIYDGSDAKVQAAMTSFVKRLADENGQYCQLVAAGLTSPDSRFVINVASGVTLSDGTQLTPQKTCWWVGGAQAGALYNQSLTYASYPGAVAASPVMANDEVIAALEAGKFVLFAENGAVKVEQDINSLVTYTPEIQEVFRKNRVMRLTSTIANDVYRQFSSNYIGVVNNDETGRGLFKAAIVGYLLELQGMGAIQNFAADDVEVLPGEAINAILVNIAIQAVDSTEKIYMTVTVR